MLFMFRKKSLLKMWRAGSYSFCGFVAARVCRFLFESESRGQDFKFGQLPLRHLLLQVERVPIVTARGTERRLTHMQFLLHLLHIIIARGAAVPSVIELQTIIITDAPHVKGIRIL